MKRIAWPPLQLNLNPNIQATLLVDASNTFNNLNRQSALLNIYLNFPSIAEVLINTFVDGETILFQEGTTQGIPRYGNVCH